MNVASPYVLGHLADDDGFEVDIVVEDAPTTADHGDELDGRLIATYGSPEQPQYSLVDRGAEGYFYRFHRFADLEISPDQRAIRCRFVEGAPRDVLPVILTGHVMATLLLLRGELVFHASAVERDGRAIALVANSGGGKSTIAAMACLAGAKLVSDDVLRVQITDDGVFCYRGGAVLRLRPTSRALADEISALEDVSADGRHLLKSDPTDLDRMPLDAVLIPRLSDAAHPLTRTRLDRKSAVFTLLEYPRVHNWTDPATSAEHFTKLAALANRIPVYTVDVPWGVTVDSNWFARLTDLMFAPEDDARAPSSHRA